MENTTLTCQECGAQFEVPTSTLNFFAKCENQFNYNRITSRCMGCNRIHTAEVLGGASLRQVVEALASIPRPH